MVQLFVDADGRHFLGEQSSFRDTWMRVALFDVIINNADRKSGHCLIDARGRIWAVDHGLTFHPVPKLRTVIWDFAGRRVPSRDRQGAAWLAAELGVPGSPLLGVLMELLARSEVAALRRRAEDLSQPCDYPAPNSDWSFPWPLV